MPKSSERPPRRPQEKKESVAPASKAPGGVWPQQAAGKTRGQSLRTESTRSDSARDDTKRGDNKRGARDSESPVRRGGDKPLRQESSGIRRERPSAAEKPRRNSEPSAPRRAAKPTEGVRKETARSVEVNEDHSGVIERKLYGVNACLAFMRARPDDIIRAYFVEEAARQHFGKMMKLLAETRRAYHIVDADEMEKVTDSTHHEGVCLLVRDAPVLRIGEWLTQARAATEIVLALEDVGNPHNLGAIMRTAAHFGVAAIMMAGAERLRSGAAMRTAAGGAENVALLEATGFIDGLKALKAAGYAIVTTSSHKGLSVFTAPWSPRVCIVMGEEQRGVSRAVQALAEQSVLIPGTGAVESLNVSVATAIVLGQCAHAQQTARRTPGTLRKPKAE